MITSLPNLRRKKQRDVKKEKKEREREGWPSPFLIFSLERGWEDDRLPSQLKERNKEISLRKRNRMRWPPPGRASGWAARARSTEKV